MMSHDNFRSHKRKQSINRTQAIRYNNVAIDLCETSAHIKVGSG